jgi:hypothetical protein
LEETLNISLIVEGLRMIADGLADEQVKTPSPTIAQPAAETTQPPAPEEEEASVSPFGAPPADPVTEKEVSLDEVRAAFTRLNTAVGAEAAKTKFKGYLKQFGVKQPQDLNAQQRREIYEGLQEAANA